MEDALTLTQKIYIAYYGRPADPAGLSYWANRIDSEGLEAVIEAFATSPESVALYGAEIGEAETAELVTAAYQQLFSREPDAAGLAFYTDRITSGEFTVATAMLDILNGARNADLQVADNKLTVAQDFTDQVTDQNLAYSGEAAAGVGRLLLDQVSASPVQELETVTQLAVEVADLASTQTELVAELIPTGGEVGDLLESLPAEADAEDLLTLIEAVVTSALDDPSVLSSLLEAGGGSFASTLEALDDAGSLAEILNEADAGGAPALEDLLIDSGTGGGIALPVPPPGPTDTTAPLLNNSIPADDADDVALNSNILLTFDSAIALGSGNIRLVNAADTSDNRTIDVTAHNNQLSLSSDGAVLTINPTDDLASNSDYYLEIDAGAITDLAGNDYAGISNSETLNFATGAEADTTAPTITAVSVANGAHGIGDTVQVTVTAGPVGSAETDLTLSGSFNGQPLTNIDNDNTDGTYTGTYTVTAGDPDVADGSTVTTALVLTDAAGNASDPFAEVTLSGESIDTTAPTLLSHIPADDADAVVAGANLVLTFDSAIVLGSGTITLVNTADTSDNRTIDVTAHSGQLSINTSGNSRVLTIDPTGDLASNSAYHLEIETGAITDVAGNDYAGISDAITLNFETAADTSPPDPSTVVFDLTTGLSSDHSSQTFAADTTYTIYIRVNSDSATVTLADDESWTGADNLGADDQVILVGDGSAILGNRGNAIVTTGGVNAISWLTTASTSIAARLRYDGDFLRLYSNANANNTVDLWAGAAVDLGRQPPLTDLPDGVSPPSTGTTDTTAPTITAVSVADGSYQLGDTVLVTVTAGNDTAGNPETGLILSGTFNGRELTDPTDNGDGTYTGTYTVSPGDADVADGSTVTTALVLTDAAGNDSDPFAEVTLAGESITASTSTVVFDLTSGLSSDHNSQAFVADVTYTIYIRMDSDSVTVTLNSGERWTGANHLGADDQLILVGDGSAILGNLGNAVSRSFGSVGTGGGPDSTLWFTEPVGGAGRAVTLNHGGRLIRRYSGANNSQAALDLWDGIATDLDPQPVLMALPGSVSLPTGEAPVIHSVSVADDTYVIGDTVQVTVIAGTDTEGNPETGLTLSGTFNGQALTNIDNSNTDGTYTGTYTVTPGDADVADGGTVNIALMLTNTDGIVSPIHNTLTLSGASIDANAPALSSSIPLDDLTGVPVSQTIQLTFDSAIVLGSGSITLVNDTDNNANLLIDVGAHNNQLSLSSDGTVLTINPTDDLALGSAYHLEIAATAITDEAGNPYAGISDAETLNFETAATTDTTAPTIASVSVADGAYQLGDTVAVIVTAGNNSEGNPETGLTLSGSFNGQELSDITDNGDGTYTGTYTLEAGDDDVAAGGTVTTALVLRDLAGNDSEVFDQVTLSSGASITPSASTVVFDLTTGLSSDHSGQTFVDDVTYSLYIKVDSDSHRITLDSDERWRGGDHLGADDQVILVGDGSAIIGNHGGTISQTSVSGLFITWSTGTGSRVSAARLLLAGGLFNRNHDGMFPGVALWGGTATGLGVQPARIELPSGVNPPVGEAPVIRSISVADGAHNIGDAVLVTVTAAPDTEGNAATGLTLSGSFNGQTLTNITDNDDGTYTGTYTVEAGDADVADGGTVTTALVLTDTAANLSSPTSTTVTLSGESITGADTTAPLLSSSIPADDATDVVSNTNISLTFDSAIVLGSGNIRLVNAADSSDSRTIDVTAHNSQLSINTSDNSRVLTIDLTDDLTSNSAYHLEIDAGAITDVAGNDYAGISDATALNFATGAEADTTAPTITSVSVPAADTYGPGDTLEFTVQFSEPVSLTAGSSGTLDSSLEFTLDSRAGSNNSAAATYASGSGSNSLIYRYTVVAGDLDNDGLSVGSALALNGDSLADNSNNAANLMLNSVADASGVLVDGVAPTITAVSVPAAGSYGLGDTLEFTVQFSEAVTLTAGSSGSLDSSLEFTLDSRTGNNTAAATYASATANSLTYRYTVVAGDLDNDGLSVGSALALNGDRLADSSGNDANLTLNNIAAATGVRVDSVAPTISSVSVADGTHGIGDTVVVTVTAGNDTAGSPETGLTLSGTFNGRDLTNIDNDNTDGTYTGTYTVEAGDADVADTGAVTTALVLTDGAGNASDPFAEVTLAGESIDANAPILSSSSPTDGASAVARDSNIVLTFDSAIALGSGNITLVNDTDNSASLVIDVTAHNGQLSINTDDNSTVLTINPSENLAHGNAYHLEVEPGAITDEVGNAYAGIRNATALNFVTLSTVVFDLTTGFSSNHSNQTFVDDVTHEIYIKVGSDSATVTLAAIEGWADADNLGADDQLILVGDGSAILGFDDNAISRTANFDNGISWLTHTTLSDGAARLSYNGVLLRFYDGAADTVDLWEGSSFGVGRREALIELPDSVSLPTGGRPTIESVSVADGTYVIGDTVEVTVTAGIDTGGTTGNPNTGLTLSGTFNGRELTDTTDNGDGTYTGTYTVEAGDPDVADTGTVTTALVLTTADGLASGVLTAVTLAGESITASTSTVVFDLTSGLSSDHSSQAFVADVTYTIYIRMDSDSVTVTLNSGERWTGGGNLGADDQLILVGDGSAILGNRGNAISRAFAAAGTGGGPRNTLWFTEPAGGVARAVTLDLSGDFTRRYSGAANTLDLWNGIATDYDRQPVLMALPGSVSLPAGEAPVIHSVSVADDTYVIGDTVQVTVIAGTDTEGNPETGLTLSGTFNGQALTNIDNSNTDGTYTGTYTVTPGDADVADGGTVNIALMLTNTDSLVSPIHNTLTLSGASIDANAPALSSSIPLDDLTGVPVSQTIQLTFDSAIVLGSGSITLVNDTDNNANLLIDVGAHNNQLSLSSDGTVLTINPTDDLALGSAYHLEIAATAITDEAGNPYAGISDAETLNFETAATTDTTAPTIASVSVADGAYQLGDTVAVIVTAGNNSEGNPETGLTLSGSFNGQELSDITANTDGTYTGTYTVEAGDDDVAAGGTVTTALVLRDLAGNDSDPLTAVTLSSGASITPSASTVVFDLTTGLSSDHSDQTFVDDVTYSLYIKVDSDSNTITLDSDERWAGADNLGTDDQVILVGDGSAILGNHGGTISQTDVSGVFITWDTGAGAGAGFTSAARLLLAGQFNRNHNGFSGVDLWGGNATGLGVQPARIELPSGVNPPVGEAPVIRSISVTDGAHNIGDAVLVTVTAAPDTEGNAATGLTLSGSFNGQTLTNITDNTDGTYTGTYTVEAGDPDVADGGTVSAALVLTDTDGLTSPVSTTVTLDGESITGTAPDTTAPTIESVSVADGNYTIGDTVQVTVTAGNDTAGNPETGLTLSGTFNGQPLAANPTDNGDGTYTGTYTVEAGDADVADSGTVTTALVLTDAAGNDSPTHTAVTLNGESITASTSTVVFDLTTGLSSGHSDRDFFADVTYTIYIKVNSDSHTLTLASGERWAGADNLNTDDQIILVGDGSAILGNVGNVIVATVEAVSISWMTTLSSSIAARLGNDGDFARQYRNAGNGVDLWDGAAVDLGAQPAQIALPSGVNPPVGEAPVIRSISVADGTHNIGDAVAVIVTAAPVTRGDSAGSPATGLTLSGDFNGQELSAITDNGDGTYTGTYTVVAGDPDVAAGGTVSAALVLTDTAANLSSPTSTTVTLSGESIDATAPTLESSLPADNADAVAPGDDIVLTFDSAIALGSGNITLVNDTDSNDSRTIDVTADSGQLSINTSGNSRVLTINPTDDLVQGNAYHLEIAAGAITDEAGNAYAGISDSEALNFATAADTSPPDPTAPSTVVFDLTSGLSSDHSSRTFAADTTYTIYIKVDSDTANTTLADDERWAGANNLGADDQIILVGTGSAIFGNAGTTYLSFTQAGNVIRWISASGGNDDNIARLNPDGAFTRFYSGSENNVDLWDDTVTGISGRDALTALPEGVSPPSTDTTAPTIESVSVADGSYQLGDTVQVTVTAGNDSEGNPETGLTLSGSFNGRALTDIDNDNTDGTYTGTYTLTAGDADVAASGTVTTALVLTDAAGNASAPLAAVTLSSDASITPSASTVVFDLTTGLSSDHSSQAFVDDVSYTIYIKVDSNAVTVTLADDESWAGANHLGADDQIILVGNGSIPGNVNADYTNLANNNNQIRWNSSSIVLVGLNYNGMLIRNYGGQASNVDLWADTFSEISAREPLADLPTGVDLPMLS